MIDRRIYDTSTMLGVLRDAPPPPSDYWLNLHFGEQVNFTDEWIDLSKIPSLNRKLAPLVVPTAQGKPIYSSAEYTSRFKAAYLKPKDPVSLDRVIKRAAGFGELMSPRPMTPQQRYDAIVADIQLQHRDAIARRWEWMAARAILDGKVLLDGEGYPPVLVDFGRDAGNTIVLTAGNRWGDDGVSIMGTIETWRITMRRAAFGGVANRLTVGTQAWDAMRYDPAIKELLNTQYRGNERTTLNMQMREGAEVEYVGNLQGLVDVYVYSDYYQSPDGTQVPFMDPRDIVLSGPSVRGVRCFGAIMDNKAQFQALPMFPKMWDSEDPSATFVMTQSAPLMVPVNPNATLRARVLA